MEEKLRKFLDPNDTAERCGLILKRGRVIEVDNVAEDPERGFEIDAAKLVEYEDRLVGTWHTHPGHGSNLSERDWFGFMQWPKLKHWIIGATTISSFIVKDGIIINGD
jgi:proteasome lid subunit RPN8/RPN11